MSNYPTHDAISEASINLTSFHKAFGKRSRSEAVAAAIKLYDTDVLNLKEQGDKKAIKKMCKNFEGREKFLLRETHNIFQNATKINIGQSLIEHAIEACEMPPKDLLNAFMTGIPAFNSMWIEWDPGFSREMTGVRFGYLIQKVGWENYNQFEAEQASPKERAKRVRERTINPEWYPDYRLTPRMGFENNWFELHKFIHRPESNEQTLIAPKCGALFSYGEEERELNERLLIDFRTGKPMSREDYQKHSTEKRGIEILTQEYVDYYSNKKAQKAFLNGLFLRFGFCQHLFAPLTKDRYASNWQADYINFINNGTPSSEWLDGHSWAMDLRFVIAVLGLLNYQREVERDIEIVDNDDIEKHLVLHEPINEVKVVEINLPKDAGVKLYGKIFKQCITRQRKHLRRGHWRTIHYKSGLIKRKWVQPYWAGDAKLGTIIHDYHLVNKKAG
tara:strand:+ start:1057 stop:2394 length:1338 start_codon:yes stop_codon:yes gene_type:complete